MNSLLSNVHNLTPGFVRNDPLRNAVVLHNKITNELSVVSTISPPVDHELIPYQGESASPVIEIGRMRKCPHCGRVFEEGSASSTSSQTGNNNNAKAFDAGTDDSFIDSNYFRLLGNSSISGEGATNNLPDSLFTQGYFNKFFKEIELLGRGARGSVYKVEHILNGVSLGFFAMKKITIGDDSKWLLKVLKEVTMLCKISFNNNNLVNYNHVWLEISSINDFGPKIPCAYILQQYCSGGNLEEFIINLQNPILKPHELKKWKLSHKRQQLKGRLLNNDEILLIFQQIVSGVYELHKNHIIHRDLKPSNCLLAEPYFTDFTQLESDISKIPTILVSDFGESQLEGEFRNATGATGTLEYTAPELLNFNDDNVPQFNKKTDVYALGMILYFMCFGKLPYEYSNEVELLKNEIKGSNELMMIDREDLLPELKYLIKNLTSKNPDERMSVSEILDVLARFDHLEKNEKEEEKIDNPQPLRRLSLTDGGDRFSALMKISRKHQLKLLVGLLNLLILSSIHHQVFKYSFIFAIGLTINQDIQNSYILTIIMIITSIILNIYNYIVQ